MPHATAAVACHPADKQRCVLCRYDNDLQELYPEESNKPEPKVINLQFKERAAGAPGPQPPQDCPELGTPFAGCTPAR